MHAAFPVELIGMVRCPKDSGTLALSEPAGAEHITIGAARCSGCGAGYEIRDGILRLLPGQQPLDSIARDEQKARDLKADRYDAHFSEFANAVELSAILNEGTPLFGKTILDLACGTGRITAHLLPFARTILAVDLSEESLRALAQKVGAGANIGLIWSDVTQLRIAPETVDLTISTQLLEHIPTVEQRARFLEGVRASLKPEGIFLLTVYYYSSLRRLLRKRQEGFHSGGIFYRRFTRGEIEREFSGLFRIAKLRPMQIDPRFLPAPFLASWLPSTLERTFLRGVIGQLLFVKATKKPAAFIRN